jgi:Protein of unknown function (DUF3052)
VLPCGAMAAGTKPEKKSAKPAAAKAVKTAVKKDVKTAAKPAGYSGTPLPQKLGIKEGHRVVLLGAPASFAATLSPLPPVRLETALPKGKGGAAEDAIDVVVLFCRARKELEAAIAGVHARLAPAGGLWVAWPKKASKIATDMTEDVVREVALPRGLVDNKVCAIDDVWSGLRLVIRKELRAK